MLINDLNLTPESTWLIGDSEDDAATAADHGLHFAAAAYGYGKVFLHTKHPINLIVHESENLCQQFQFLLTKIMNNEIFEDLFVLELANNHLGDLQRGLEIIKQHGQVVRFNGVSRLSNKIAVS